jgi:hypothetical protein
MANEVDGGNHGELQQSVGSVGAARKDEAAVAFTAAYWAWLRCQRDYAPYAEEHGLTYAQGAAILRQIKLTDEYRKLRHEYAMSNPFQSWTEADVAAWNARVRKQNGIRSDDAMANVLLPIRESKLHDQILAECTRRGWIALHGSMAHRTRRNPGEFDFVLIADHGRTLLVEVKTAKGKLTDAQLGMQCWAKKLGHDPHVVRSFEQFLEVIR